MTYIEMETVIHTSTYIFHILNVHFNKGSGMYKHTHIHTHTHTNTHARTHTHTHTHTHIIFPKNSCLLTF